MKFVIIGPVYPYRGGISHHNSSLILAIQSLGHDVLPISFKRQYPKFLYPGKSDKDPSKVRMSIDALFILDPIDPFSWIRAIREIEKFGPDKVVFHWWSSFWAPMYIYLLRNLSKNKKSSVCIVHNVFPHEKRYFDKFLAKLILKSFSKLIVHSIAEQEKIKKLGIQSVVSYIPHPIYDTLASNVKIDKTEAKTKLGFSIDKTIILMFGIVRKYKGLSVLLDSIKILIEDDHKEIHLLVAGEFWEPVEQYRQKIHELKIDEYVTIQNRYISNEDIPVIFTAADLFVAPYTGGTQSGAIKLAMAFDLPIISTTIVGDESKYVDNWKKVIPGNPKVLSRAIQEFDFKTKNYTNVGVSWEEFAQLVETI